MDTMNNRKKQSTGRRYSIGFSVAGSLLIILFLAFINFSTGVKFPWFVFPAYAVLWWPILTIFIGRHSVKALSLIGSLATIALLVIVNYLTSWSYPWFLYPSFAILWWPLSAFLGQKHSKSFSIAGTLVLTVFFLITNYISSPSYIWFYYPLFALIWWPLSIFFARPETMKGYSILGAVILLGFFTLDNRLHSPFCPWALFTYFPVLMWPAGVMLNRRLSKLSAALMISAAGILYYVILNVYVFQGFPWAIFPAYAFLWWPLAIAFAKRGRLLHFSIIAFLMTAALFITVNLITSPQVIWAVYPIFGLIWWPLATYYFVYRRGETGIIH